MRQFFEELGKAFGASSAAGVIMGGFAGITGETYQTIVENVYAWTLLGVIVTVPIVITNALRQKPAVVAG